MVVISSFSPPTDGVRHEQPFTALCMGSRELGKGTLFITEKCLSWMNTATGQGFSLEYPHIALHAISRDLRAYPHECLYIMVDTKIDGEQEPQDDNTNEAESEGESELNMTELRFVPEDKGMLEAMFHALIECQALHPDTDDSFSDGDFIFGDDDNEGEYQLGGGDGPFIGLGKERNGDFLESEETPGTRHAQDVRNGTTPSWATQLSRFSTLSVSNRPPANGVSAEEEPMEMDIGQFEDAEGEPEH